MKQKTFFLSLTLHDHYLVTLLDKFNALSPSPVPLFEQKVKPSLKCSDIVFCYKLRMNLKTCNFLYYIHYQNKRQQINDFKIKVIILGKCPQNFAQIILSIPIPQTLSYINQHFVNSVYQRENQGVIVNYAWSLMVLYKDDGEGGFQGVPLQLL